ncbi:carbohydrate-binding family 9-like protein [Polaribacter sp.]|uniref:carbohydrate-binding family 9-like protein n=1 Tax=Polaribacter sp. TaxID=1920175 RepID=UPI003F6C185A
MKKLFQIGVLTVLISCSSKEKIRVTVADHIIIPKNYVVHKVTSEIIIDGKPDEKDWKNAKFTDSFIDIEGVKIPKQDTKVKMLWDDTFLYVYAKLKEKHIWGDITKRDEVIFYNNDFEVFINPSNDTHMYGEIEINPLNTVWDLLLNKPYNVGGKPINTWNLTQLQSAIFIKGSLNDFSDEDEFWAVEMAIPLKPLIALKNNPKSIPIDGEQWRINFSRVEWDFDIIHKTYQRKKVDDNFLPEYNWVWSNQGAINMHLPENWGYLQFSTKNASKNVVFTPKTSIISEQISYALYRKINFGKLQYLKDKPAGFIINFETIDYKNTKIDATFLKTYSGFNIITKNKKLQQKYSIREDGLLQRN